MIAGLAAMLAATSASAQLQINGSSQPTVNAWDVLESNFSHSIKVPGCTDGACSIDALVFDNQAGGDCFETALMVGSYDMQGRTVTGTEVAVKVDAESIAATRYYRALVRVTQPGAQRLCVRRSVQVEGLRFTVTLDRPETAEQLAQAAGVQTRNNRSSSELRLAPFVNSRGVQARPDGWGERMASLILYSDRRTAIGVSIRSPGGRLAIGHGDRIIGYTDQNLFVPPHLLRDIYVTKAGEKVAIGSCAKTVDDTDLIVTC